MNEQQRLTDTLIRQQISLQQILTYFSDTKMCNDFMRLVKQTFDLIQTFEKLVRSFLADKRDIFIGMAIETAMENKVKLYSMVGEPDVLQVTIVRLAVKSIQALTIILLSETSIARMTTDQFYEILHAVWHLGFTDEKDEQNKGVFLQLMSPYISHGFTRISSINSYILSLAVRMFNALNNVRQLADIVVTYDSSFHVSMVYDELVDTELVFVAGDRLCTAELQRLDLSGAQVELRVRNICYRKIRECMTRFLTMGKHMTLAVISDDRSDILSDLRDAISRAKDGTHSYPINVSYVDKTNALEKDAENLRDRMCSLDVESRDATLIDAFLDLSMAIANRWTMIGVHKK